MTNPQHANDEVAGELLTPKQAAARTGYAESTLANLRSSGKGPPFFKAGGGKLIRYDSQDLDRWMRLQRCTSTSEATVNARAS